MISRVPFSLCKTARAHDPKRGALAWLAEPGNPGTIVHELADDAASAVEHKAIWVPLLEAHASHSGTTAPNRATTEFEEILLLCGLLCRLSDETLEVALSASCSWLSRRSDTAMQTSKATALWHRLWNLAIARPGSAERAIAKPADETLLQPLTELAPLGHPCSPLTDAWLALVQRRRADAAVFAIGSDARAMRDSVETAPAPVRTIARYRLLADLNWLVTIDERWVDEFVLAPLLDLASPEQPLWAVVASRRQRPEVLARIADAMARVASDRRHEAGTRKGAAIQLVLDGLWARKDGRPPMLGRNRVQQMLRTVDEPTRTAAAEMLPRFLTDSERPDEENTDAHRSRRAELYRSTVGPFLQTTWPQEVSLSTPGVSRAFSRIPTVAGNAFVDAATTVARFLLPYDCWSMLDYGFHPSADRESLDLIEGPERADALLNVLDRTVGTAPSAVVPLELGDALARIEQVAPELGTTRAYRRLVSATVK